MSHPRAAWGSTGEKRFATTDTLLDKFLIEYADALAVAEDATYDVAFDPDFHFIAAGRAYLFPLRGAPR